MVTHCIITSSSYTRGTRIAIDYCSDEPRIKEYLQNRINEITEKCGDDVSISSHYIQTESKDWKSVCKKDKFFEDVELVKSIEKFINIINKDRELKGIDVAKYILSKIDCTHLKLEKMTYLCYAEYLFAKDKKMFMDNIYAFMYGPVVETVYDSYKHYKDKEEKNIDRKKISEMPSKSRILFARDGMDKFNCIEKTIEKYGKYSAAELVNITHKKNSPWDIAYDGTDHRIIKDDIIKKHHCVEAI